MKELKIDPKLAALFKPLEKEQLDELEEKLKAKYDGTPLYVWKGNIIVDGHNRYSICRKHNIDYTIGTLAYETKEEVMRWMLDIQLGRRNLTPIQRISVAEKHRALFEKQAKEKQATSTGGVHPQLRPEMVQAEKSEDPNENKTVTKLAAIAGVKRETYRMGAKILNSDNDELKQRVLSGKTSITAGYKELQNKNKPKVNDVAEKFWKTVRRFTVLFIWTHRIQRCNPLTLRPFGRRPFSNVHTVHNG